MPKLEVSLVNQVLYEFPAYAREIIESLIETDWLIHSFQLDDKKDIYNPAGYLYNAEFNGVEYTIHLDLNVYQYILSAYKKKKKKKIHRDAIALMVFGKFTNSIFDPTIAIYEKLNYLEQCPDEILDDLFLFKEIDNAEMDELAKFALGHTDDIKLPEVSSIERDTLKLELTKYRRLKKWDNFYLFVLKTTELYYFDDSPIEDKISKFLSWCFSDFLYSLVAISFVIKLMGKESSPKLMKYKASQNIEQKKSSLINMTWDLFLLDKYFENWIKKEENKEFVYASNDKPLKEVLEIAISIQIEGNTNHLHSFISPSLIDRINKIEGTINNRNDRKISNVSDFKNFRDELIKGIELSIVE